MDMMIYSFISALAAIAAFYIVFFIQASPLFKKHGIVPSIRRGYIYINEDVNRF